MNQCHQDRLTHLRQMLLSSWPVLTRVFVQFIIAIAAGYVFDRLHVPVAWLLGPMVAMIGYAIIQGKPQPLPSVLFIAGQAIVAIATATGFSLQTLGLMKTYTLPLLVCITMTGGMSVLNGYLLWRWAGVERATGFLGCLPGAAHSLIAMSEDMGADAIAVAVLQYLRILLVSVIIPSLVGLWFAPQTTPELVLAPVSPHLPTLPAVYNLAILIAGGTLGVIIGKKFRFPSPLFFGPFLISLIIFWLLPYSILMPPLLFKIGLILVGLSIGLKFDWQTAKKLWKAVLLEVILVILLIFLCLAVGYGFHLATNVDAMTAILGSTPGGITAMIATVIQLGGDTGVVLAMQMTRMLLLLLLSPWFGSLLIKQSELNQENPSS